MKKMEKTREEKAEALEQYYEAAGFSDYRNNILDKMSGEEIDNAYIEVYGDEADQD